MLDVLKILMYFFLLYVFMYLWANPFLNVKAIVVLMVIIQQQTVHLFT